MKTLLAIDQGTTSSRAILFSKEGKILSTQQKELENIYPNKGWVEQNPEHIWSDTLWACETILNENNHGQNVTAIGITNQRETTIIWDRKTGKPIYNAIVWQDRRTADFCAALKGAGHEDTVRRKTGLLLDPYFSATKIKWVLDNVEGARHKAESGELAFGTIDSFLLWRLTDGKVHATDATNASRTMIYNIIDGCWDDALLNLFDIPKSLLPDVHDNCHDYGIAKIGDHKIPVCGMAGDQQAALVGQTCFEAGMVKSTYGTGCFALMNIGDEFKQSENRLLTTVAYQFKGQTTYAIEGAIFVAGAAIQWLRDNVGLLTEASDSEALAMSVEDNNDVYFVPAFTGLGAPYWEPNAKAMITGLSRESNKAHIIRAALEAQGYQTHDLIGAFKKDSGEKIKTIRIDGGLAENTFVCQFLADILQCKIEVPEITETTALGAAYLAGLQIGIYKDKQELASIWQLKKDFQHKMSNAERDKLLTGWARAIGQVLKKS